LKKRILAILVAFFTIATAFGIFSVSSTNINVIITENDGIIETCNRTGLEGIVYNDSNVSPIQGALVEFYEGGILTEYDYTNSDRYFYISVPLESPFYIIVKMDGYDTHRKFINPESLNHMWLNVFLQHSKVRSPPFRLIRCFQICFYSEFLKDFLMHFHC
jgi:hypothetical protein